MTELPCSANALVVRTDFSSAVTWEALRLALSSPSEDGSLACVELVDARQFTGVTPEGALSLLPVPSSESRSLVCGSARRALPSTVGVARARTAVKEGRARRPSDQAQPCCPDPAAVLPSSGARGQARCGASVAR
ncbi:DUF6924 domain-containing protein [Streptomyces sp. NPDC087843]|uniref:DUF6924 domain-containing protein n=1 Tax=Streptomyces sp. NPDC087843 TaxID=3365804 RepID=UPI0037FC765C